MAASSGSVSLRFDGEDRPRIISLRPVGLMAAERRWGGDAFTAHPIEATLFAAWVSAGKQGGDDGFDVWAASIEELVTEGADANPPSATLPVPSPPLP